MTARLLFLFALILPATSFAQGTLSGNSSDLQIQSEQYPLFFEDQPLSASYILKRPITFSRFALSRITKLSKEGAVEAEEDIPISESLRENLDNQGNIVRITFEPGPTLFAHNQTGAQLFVLRAFCANSVSSEYDCGKAEKFAIYSHVPKAPKQTDVIGYRCMGEITVKQKQKNDSKLVLRHVGTVNALTQEADVSEVLKNASLACQYETALKSLIDYCENSPPKKVHNLTQYLQVTLSDGKSRRYNVTSQLLKCED